MKTYLSTVSVRPATLFALAAIMAIGCGESSTKKTDTADAAASTDVVETDDAGQVATEGLSIGSTEARGCELLLTESGATVTDVVFSDAVKGTFIRQAPRVAISFVSASDAAIPAGAVGLVTAGSTADLAITSVSCVGSDGKSLENVSVQLP